MGPEREPRHGELLLGDVAVDLCEELVDRALAAARQGVGHPLVAAETMGDEGVDHVGDVVHQAAVPRAEGADRRHLVAHTGEAVEVLVQVAVGRADDDGRAVHHVVAGQQQRMLLDQPAEVVGRVARRVQRTQGEGRTARRRSRAQRHGEEPALAHALVGREALGRAEADEPRRWSRRQARRRRVRGRRGCA